MAGPQKLSKEEYSDFRSKMEEKYGYDEMSDEEKERFNDTMDKVAVEDTDKNDKTDNTDDGDEPEGRQEREIPHKERDDEDENIR